MKFRMLNEEELKIFEEDLKHFLISNGVDGDEWKRINENDPEKAVQLVGLFSDVVMQKVYERLKVIEYRSEQRCMVFKLDPDQIHLIALSAELPLNLSTPESIHDALRDHADKVKFFKQSKQYTKNRELEIHGMIEMGCVPSQLEFWNLLEQSIN